MMGTQVRSFTPLPPDISLEDLVPITLAVSSAFPTNFLPGIFNPSSSGKPYLDHSLNGFYRLIRYRDRREGPSRVWIERREAYRIESSYPKGMTR